MSIFRRETSKAWLRSMSVFFPLLWIGVIWMFHHFAKQLPLTGILCLAGIFIIITCIRLFINADRMMIEVFHDRIDWFCFLATPPKASIPMEMIKEVIVYKTRSNQLVPTSASLILVDGKVVGIPNPTGSYLPILKAIKQARPEIAESIRVGMSPEQRQIFWNLITGKTKADCF
jgi:hypothetical protein